MVQEGNRLAGEALREASRADEAPGAPTRPDEPRQRPQADGQPYGQLVLAGQRLASLIQRMEGRSRRTWTSWPSNLRRAEAV